MSRDWYVCIEIGGETLYARSKCCEMFVVEFVSHAFGRDVYDPPICSKCRKPVNLKTSEHYYPFNFLRLHGNNGDPTPKFEVGSNVSVESEDYQGLVSSRYYLFNIGWVYQLDDKNTTYREEFMRNAG